MDDSAQSPCFAFGKKSSKKADIRRKKDAVSLKNPPVCSISPLSSMNSDEAIKAHRMEYTLEPTPTPVEQVDVRAQLARERVERQALESQLATALNVNAEMKLAMTLGDEDAGQNVLAKKLARLRNQLVKEHKEKEELAVQLSAAKREGAATRSALNAARTQRDELEAELMEAALDVIDGKKQRGQLETLMRSEKAARCAAEEAVAESEALRRQLKAAEAAKAVLEEKLASMSHEAKDWELALDCLQERLEGALQNRPLDSIAFSDFVAPTTPPQTMQVPLAESVVNADVAIKDGLKGGLKSAASKPEPWRQVVLKRPVAI